MEKWIHYSKIMGFYSTLSGGISHSEAHWSSLKTVDEALYNKTKEMTVAESKAIMEKEWT